MIIENELVIEAFERFKETNSVSSEPDEIILTSKKVLFKKLIKNKKLYKFREECKNEFNRREVQRKRRERILTDQVPPLMFKLECAYDLANFLHLKILSKIKAGGQEQEIENYLRDAGRTIGAKLYDLPAIQSGLYSLDALTNIASKRKFTDRATTNTNEHFFSLYANAGPLILRKAMLQTMMKGKPNFQLSEFVRIVSYLNQTIKTTRLENARLQQYHSFNSLINVQESYDKAIVSRLVNCGHDYDSDIHIKWMFACQEHGFDLKIEAGRHFTGIIELEDAIEAYPEIKNIKKYLPKSLKPYRG